MVQDDAECLLNNVNEKIHAVLVINAEGEWEWLLVIVSVF